MLQEMDRLEELHHEGMKAIEQQREMLWKQELAELEAAKSRSSMQNLCVVCQVEQINTVMMPCSHLRCCGACSTACRTCPICHVNVETYVRTYLS